MAEATRERIRKIIEELNYQPNILASTLASKKSALFATLLPQPPSSEGYWNKPVVGIKRRIVELKQYGVQIQAFNFLQSEPESFIIEAKKILELNPDGVLMAPFFKKEAIHFIEALKEQKIPFVFIDSEIKDAGQLSYIGQDSFQSGLVSGKLLDLLLGEGNILIVHFAKQMDNHNHLVQREKGFYSWFKGSSLKTRQLFTVEIADTDDEVWKTDLLHTIMKNDIGGIFVTNSKAFLVARLIEEKGLNHLKLIGHDLVKENVNYLKKDIVHFLICQRPEEQGYNAINKLFRSIIQKRMIAKENYTSIDIVTKENVDFYKEFK